MLCTYFKYLELEIKAILTLGSAFIDFLEL